MQNDLFTVLKTDKENTKSKVSILDGCDHIYLVVRSNIGIQIQILLEPGKYSRAKSLPIYDAVFGSIDRVKKKNHPNEKKIYAVGFEPNPVHTQYLKEFEASYNKCSYNVTFSTFFCSIRYIRSILKNLQ